VTNQNNPKTIFMGTSVFAEEILASLIAAKYDIVAVYTQADKKVGRAREIQKSPVRTTAEKNILPVFTPQKFDAEVIAQLTAQNPELIIVAAYGKILPQAVLNLPCFGALNVHTSLLPKYRGPSPIHNAILAGETETGTTIMLMDAGVDTGDILTQEKINIDKHATTLDFSKKLAALSARLLLQTIPRYLAGKITPQKQRTADTTLCRMLKKEDGQIDWSDSAQSIYNRYRAFFPWPGIFTFWETKGAPKRLKLTKIHFNIKTTAANHQVGEVFQIEKQIAVQTGNGFIILEEVQIEGKTPMKIQDFLNGYSNFLNSVLK